MPSASTLKGNLFTCQVFLANAFSEPAIKPGQPTTLHALQVLKTHVSHFILSGAIRSEGAFEKSLTRQYNIRTEIKGGNCMSFSRLILDQLAALKADERRKGDKVIYLDLGGNVGAHAIAVASRQLNTIFY